MGLNPLSLLSGVWGYVGAGALGALAVAPAVYYVVHNANASEIAGLNLKISQSQTQVAQSQTQSVTASLDQLQKFIAQMHTADADYQASLTAINSSFDVLKKGLSDAIKAKPLPVDCKPDPARVRSLAAAYSAATGKNSTP